MGRSPRSTSASAWHPTEQCTYSHAHLCTHTNMAHTRKDRETWFLISSFKGGCQLSRAWRLMHGYLYVSNFYLWLNRPPVPPLPLGLDPLPRKLLLLLHISADLDGICQCLPGSRGQTCYYQEWWRTGLLSWGLCTCVDMTLAKYNFSDTYSVLHLKRGDNLAMDREV